MARATHFIKALKAFAAFIKIAMPTKVASAQVAVLKLYLQRLSIWWE